MLRQTALFILCVFICSFSVASNIAPTPTIEHPVKVKNIILKQIKSFKCTFVAGVCAKYSNDGINVKSCSFAKKKENRVVYFDSIDLKNRKARFIANAGAEDVRAFITPRGLQFVEFSQSGNPIYTTIFNVQKRVGIKVKFPIVMSRHINVINDPIPSQYYGYCVPHH